MLFKLRDRVFYVGVCFSFYVYSLPVSATNAEVGGLNSLGISDLWRSSLGWFVGGAVEQTPGQGPWQWPLAAAVPSSDPRGGGPFLPTGSLSYPGLGWTSFGCLGCLVGLGSI